MCVTLAVVSRQLWIHRSKFRARGGVCYFQEKSMNTASLLFAGNSACWFVTSRIQTTKAKSACCFMSQWKWKSWKTICPFGRPYLSHVCFVCRKVLLHHLHATDGERDGLVESTLAVWWMHKFALCVGLCVWEDLWWNVCFFPASYLPCRRFLEICTYCGVMIGSRVHLFRFSAWEPNFYSVNSKSLDLKI